MVYSNNAYIQYINNTVIQYINNVHIQLLYVINNNAQLLRGNHRHRQRNSVLLILKKLH